MATGITFVDRITAITTNWLNATDYVVYDVFNNPTSIGADGTIWVSNGTTYVEESGATARTSLGLGTTDAPSFATGTTIGNLTLANGSITDSGGTISFGNEILSTTGGIAFNNETLSEYDEGTFTAIAADASSGGNASATSIPGRYVRVGKVVNIWIEATDIDTTGLTAGNDIFIRALPFTAETTNTIDPCGSIVLQGVTFAGVVHFLVGQGTTFGRLAETTTGAALDYVIVSQVADDAGDMFIQITYEID